MKKPMSEDAMFQNMLTKRTMIPPIVIDCPAASEERMYVTPHRTQIATAADKSILPNLKILNLLNTLRYGSQILAKTCPNELLFALGIHVRKTLTKQISVYAESAVDKSVRIV